MVDARDLIIEREFAAFRPSGAVRLELAVVMITSAIGLARAKGIRKLLVNTCGWRGLQSPTVTDRYFFVNEWAKAADGMVRVAVVASPELIDPEKFGVLVARNCGLLAEVFISEREALTWLLGAVESNERRCTPPAAS